MDRVAVALGVGQPLQHHDADAFARHEAVGALVEGEARPSGDSMPACAVLMCIAGPAITYTPPASARSLLPEHQAVAGLGDRDQRGRAGRVDREARALQVQEDRRCAPPGSSVASPVKPCALSCCSRDSR